MSINYYVEKLPEIYQHIYNHPEFNKTSRTCEDREQYIVQVVSALQKKLNKKNIKVLDLGCAQGYFSLTLANMGCQVKGIDFCKENIELCNALNEENGFNSEFVEGKITKEVIDSIENEEYDVILFLSVVHHICNENGFEYARNLFTTLADKSKVVIAELAVKTEPLYWNKNLPQNYDEWFKDVAFFNELSMIPTHLSEIERPLLVYSNKMVYCNLKFYDFSSHKFKGYDYKSCDFDRRYYFSDDYLIKYYRGIQRVITDEIIREANFIKEHQDISFLPKLINLSQEINTIVVYQIKKGELLIDKLIKHEEIDVVKLAIDIINQLIELEEINYYHGDLRIWNVCKFDKNYFLIDFGNIQKDIKDNVAVMFNPDFSYTVFDAYVALLFDCLVFNTYDSIQKADYYCLSNYFFHKTVSLHYQNFFKAYLVERESIISYGQIKYLFTKYVINKEPLNLTDSQKIILNEEKISRVYSNKVSLEKYKTDFRWVQNEIAYFYNDSTIKSNIIETQKNEVNKLKSIIEKQNLEVSELKKDLNEQKNNITELVNHIDQVHRLLLFTKNRTFYGFCAYCFRKLFKRK